MREEEASRNKEVVEALEHLSSWERTFWEMLQERKRTRGSGLETGGAERR